MGQGIMVACSECYNEQGYTLGIGMMYSSLENVTSDIHWRTRNNIAEFSSAGNIISEEFEHKLFYCKKCLTSHSRFWIKIEKDCGAIFETEFKCSKCKSEMIEGDLNFTKYSCNSCGKKTLSISSEMDWD